MKNLLFVGSNSLLARSLLSYLKLSNENLNIYKISSKISNGENTFFIKSYIDNELTTVFNKIILEKKIDTIFIFNGSSDENKNYSQIIDINMRVPIRIIEVCNDISLNHKIYLKVIFISSVASKFIKLSNYNYGLSKFFVEMYLLNKSFQNKFISYLIFRLGPFESKLTENFRPRFLVSGINSISIKIYKNLRKNNKTITLPKFWFLINLVLNLFPFLKKKL